MGRKRKRKLRVIMSGSNDEYFWCGSGELAEEEYKRFQGSLMQLLDDETMIGDVEGRWVIFKDGWVYGMSTYSSKVDATSFARQIFRDEPSPSYIVVQVDPEKHALSAMHLLASALGDIDSIVLQSEEHYE